MASCSGTAQLGGPPVHDSEPASQLLDRVCSARREKRSPESPCGRTSIQISIVLHTPLGLAAPRLGARVRSETMIRGVCVFKCVFPSFSRATHFHFQFFRDDHALATNHAWIRHQTAPRSAKQTRSADSSAVCPACGRSALTTAIATRRKKLQSRNWSSKVS